MFFFYCISQNVPFQLSSEVIEHLKSCSVNRVTVSSRETLMELQGRAEGERRLEKNRVNSCDNRTIKTTWKVWKGREGRGRRGGRDSGRQKWLWWATLRRPFSKETQPIQIQAAVTKWNGFNISSDWFPSEIVMNVNIVMMLPSYVHLKLYYIHLLK